MKIIKFENSKYYNKKMKTLNKREQAYFMLLAKEISNFLSKVKFEIFQHNSLIYMTITCPQQNYENFVFENMKQEIQNFIEDEQQNSNDKHYSIILYCVKDAISDLRNTNSTCCSLISNTQVQEAKINPVLSELLNTKKQIKIEFETKNISFNK